MYLIVGNVALNVDQYTKFEKVKIAYFDADGGPITQQFERFLQTKDTLATFDIQKVTSLNEGIQMVRDGKIETLIY
ncbi:MAG: ABC transporter permease, partial [Desulfosporosinus sp.]